MTLHNLHQLKEVKMEEGICATCWHYERDGEYPGLGICKNEEVIDERIIFKNCDEIYLAEDFGCIYWKGK